MRRLTIVLAVFSVVLPIGLAGGGFTATASARQIIKLAQSSTKTNCMNTCNNQFVNCQSSCIAGGTTNQGGVTTATTNVSPSATCISACTNQQLSCQVICSRGASQ
jgi:hypothetical protein